MSDPTAGGEVLLLEDEGSVQSRGLLSDATYDLRRNWVFWASAILLVGVAALVLVPGLIADVEKTSSLTGGCQLSESLEPPSSEHWFGTDQQGCDVYALTVFGARPSVLVGVFGVLITTAIGSIVGLIAGFYGRWVDAVISRIVDVFYGLPLILGGIALLSAVRLPGIWGVVLVLAVLGWVPMARMVRSTTIEGKGQDYALAARALGASNSRLMFRHILPNAIGPGIVLAVVSLGAFVAVEATFSFLGLGLQPPDFSWGTMISDAQTIFFQAPWALFFPAGFLSLTVLAFILLGDAVRDALDPRAGG